MKSLDDSSAHGRTCVDVLRFKIVCRLRILYLRNVFINIIIIIIIETESNRPRDDDACASRGLHNSLVCNNNTRFARDKWLTRRCAPTACKTSFIEKTYARVVGSSRTGPCKQWFGGFDRERFDYTSGLSRVERSKERKPHSFVFCRWRRRLKLSAGSVRIVTSVVSPVNHPVHAECVCVMRDGVRWVICFVFLFELHNMRSQLTRTRMIYCDLNEKNTLDDVRRTRLWCVACGIIKRIRNKSKRFSASRKQNT